MISCPWMRSTVVLSAALLVTGILLLGIAETTGLPVPTAHLALLAVLSGAATLALALVVAIVPATRRRLDNCEH